MNLTSANPGDTHITKSRDLTGFDGISDANPVQSRRSRFHWFLGKHDFRSIYTILSFRRLQSPRWNVFEQDLHCYNTIIQNVVYVWFKISFNQNFIHFGIIYRFIKRRDWRLGHQASPLKPLALHQSLYHLPRTDGCGSEPWCRTLEYRLLTFELFLKNGITKYFRDWFDVIPGLQKRDWQ